MKKTLLFAAAIGVAATLAGALVHRSAIASADAANKCVEATCFIDGMTPHWSQQFDNYRDADEAAAKHREDNGYRHQVLTGPCDW